MYSASTEVGSTITDSPHTFEAVEGPKQGGALPEPLARRQRQGVLQKGVIDRRE